jgi:glycosyltransferase involved in cell wall biosynthesis
MAAGLPVVCFDTANNRKFLRELGFYAPERSADSLARMIIAALDDQEAVTRGAQGRNIIRSTYSMGEVGRSLVTVYKQIVHNASVKL